MDECLSLVGGTLHISKEESDIIIGDTENMKHIANMCIQVELVIREVCQ